MQRAGEVADFVGGFVAGEGSFTNSGQRFAFSVGLGAADRSMCDLLRLLLGVGSITFFARRQSHYNDEVTYIVQAMGDLVEVVVPFMDEHLPASYKRQQYEAWRTRLIERWEAGALRGRPCTVEGCDEPQRAKGVCRRHYYLQYGGWAIMRRPSADPASQPVLEKSTRDGYATGRPSDVGSRSRGRERGGR